MKKFEWKKNYPLDLTSIQIESDRLFLKSIQMRYAKEIFKTFTSEITRFMYPRPPLKSEETQSFIEHSLAGMRKGWDLVLVIIKKDNEEFLGCCGFHGKRKPRTPELGIWIKKEAHGYHYGRESVQALTMWASESIDFEYAIYPVDKANLASRKIPEALGGIITGQKVLKTKNGNYLDEVIYRLPSVLLKP